MQRLLCIVFFAALIAACSPAQSMSNVEEPTLDPDQPVSSEDTPAPTQEPTLREGQWIMGEATVDEIDIRFLESFPLQIHVGVRGTIGDSCTELDEIVTTREENTFYIDITTARPADEICTQIAVPFEENIPLDVYGLPAGTYTVNANGTTATFTLEQDNILEPTSDALLPPPGVLPGQAGQFVYELAHVTDVAVSPRSQPPSATIRISGWLPSPCHELTDIREDIVGNAIRLTVEDRAPIDMACIAVIEEFTITHTIAQLPGRGTYTLVVNDVASQFTVE